jgi:hypothetical protein
MGSRPATWTSFALCGLFLCCLPATAWAQDVFEIQVYDSETAPTGETGLELHLNHSFGGSTVSNGGVLPPAGVTRMTLEPHLGCASWCEVGFYLQTALYPDGRFDYAGVKLRWKVRSTRKYWEGQVGLALNTELSILPKAYESQVYGGELRPVIDFRRGAFYAAFNPILDFNLAGTNVGRPDFEPALKLAFQLLPHWAAGTELYGSTGILFPAGSSGSNGPNLQRVLGVVDFEAGSFSLNLGAGYQWGGTPQWLVKAIVGFGGPKVF